MQQIGNRFVPEECDVAKVRFDTEWDANYRLGEIIRNPQTSVWPTHYFECELCGGWHLTKNPREGAKSYNARLGGRARLPKPVPPVVLREPDHDAPAVSVVPDAEPVKEVRMIVPADPRVFRMVSRDQFDTAIMATLREAMAQFNEETGRGATMRIFRQKVRESLDRVRELNRSGDYCKNPTDPRHDEETCPTDHRESA